MIEKELPYLNDSGGQYLDGTCDTTRTVHFGRPTNEQCEAFTRVLQGHVCPLYPIFKCFDREFDDFDSIIRLPLTAPFSQRVPQDPSLTCLPAEHYGKTE